MNRIIETERLILRPLRVSDAPDMFEWVSDPIVNRFMLYSLYDNVHQAEEWIASLGDRNEFGFSLKETGKVIGAGSMLFNEKENAYELGYNFNRAYWGKGYGTEAAKALIDWAYRELGARDFFACHANANTASGNVIRKCGFRFVRGDRYEKLDGSAVFDASCYTMHLD